MEASNVAFHWRHSMITVIFSTESEYQIILNVCQMSTNVMIAECVQMCRTELKCTRMSANIRKCEPHMVDLIKCYLVHLNILLTEMLRSQFQMYQNVSEYQKM